MQPLCEYKKGKILNAEKTAYGKKKIPARPANPDHELIKIKD